MKLSTLSIKITTCISCAVFAASAFSTAASTLAKAAETRTAQDVIREGLKARKTGIDLRKYVKDITEAAEYYYEVLYTDSDWIDVDSSFRYLSGYLFPEYLCSASEAASRKTKFDQTVNKIVSRVRPEWTDAEKVLYLHDTLIERCEYDFTYTNYDAYSALVSGSAVCQGYALALNVMCHKIGIPSYVISSDEHNHMWNVVQIDGEWYHVDATYDDHSPDIIGYAEHSFFLKNEEYMMESYGHAASDWEYYSEGSLISCTSDAFDHAYWVNVLDTVEPLPDGTFFYTRSNSPDIQYASEIKADFCRGNSAVGENILMSNSISWKSPGEGKLYGLSFIKTDVYGDKVYYHTDDSIFAMGIDGYSVEWLYSLSQEERALGSIYGISIDDKTGVLTYQIMKQFVFPDETNTIDKTFHTIQLDVIEEETTEEETTTTTTTTATEETTTTTTTTVTEEETTSTTTTTTTEETTSATTTTTTTEETTSTTAAVSEETTAVSEEDDTTIPAEETTAAATSNEETTAQTEETTVTTADTEDTTLPAEETTATTITTEETAIPVEETTAETENTTIPTTETTTTAEETTTTSTVTAPVVMMLRGDVDCSSRVNVMDAVLLARLNAEQCEDSEVDAQGKANADCTDDGVVNADDLRWLLLFLSKML